MTFRIAINGFGRIGRCIMRAALNSSDLEIVHINDITDAKTLAYLLKYDSVHGILGASVEDRDGAIVVNGREVAISAERDPGKLPWGQKGIDLVMESTGLFRSSDQAGLHLKAGAKKVIISAPAKDKDTTTLCMGINHKKYDPSKDHVVSNASCTTNCLAPVAKVLLDSFGIEHGLMTTFHSYTNDQRILDLPHKDLRRARAAAMSMIPTTTGAAKAVGLVIPELAGKFDGMSVRCPTPNVSLVDLVCVVMRATTKEGVNEAMKRASEGDLKGILAYNDQPTVSIDFNGNPHSSIFDSTVTNVMGDKLVKVMAWYDNEWAYSVRMVDLARYMLNKG